MTYNKFLLLILFFIIITKIANAEMNLGTFIKTWSFEENLNVKYIFVCDINKDGRLDFIVGNWNQKNLVFLNIEENNFKKIVLSKLLDTTLSIYCADYNNDGNLDIIVGNDNKENKIYKNINNEEFQLQWVAHEKNSTSVIKWIDINNDSKLEIIEGNWGQVNKIYIDKGYNKSLLSN